MGEFDLIARYFTRPVQRAVLGVGDDCALLAPAPGMQLAISSDMLVRKTIEAIPLTFGASEAVPCITPRVRLRPTKSLASCSLSSIGRLVLLPQKPEGT